jgi:2-polyprenyl-3-methyl-5-hydroxy-6-metoxy-1,4-benzoquinol methylase
MVYPATRTPEPLRPGDLACTTALLASYDTLARCLDCGMYYTSPRTRDDDIRAAYAEMADTGFLEERHARELTYRRMLDSIERLTGGRRGRLLDAGCSMGFFLKQARDRGWQVEGIEPSRWAAEYARKEWGLRVYDGPVGSADLAPESVDVVTMWDVVEHLLDPVGDVRRLARALKPGGVFALSTHSLGSLSARLLGRRYPFLMAMHVSHFTPRTTARLLGMAGLNQIRVRPHLRFLRVGYLIRKMAPKAPRFAALLDRIAGALAARDRYVAVTGLGIFNAYAIKGSGPLGKGS